MNLVRILLVAFVSIYLAACAATYHAAGSSNSGYRDIQVRPGVFYVEYTESISRNWETVRGFALKRCAEIAKENGYKFFDVLSKDEKIVQLSTNVDEVVVPGVLGGGDIGRGRASVPASISMKGSKVEGRRVTYKIQLLNE